jgi:hypothetical protein
MGSPDAGRRGAIGGSRARRAIDRRSRSSEPGCRRLRFTREGVTIGAQVHFDDETIAEAQERLTNASSVGQQRMAALHGGRRDRLEVYPNLWAGGGSPRVRWTSACAAATSTAAWQTKLIQWT